MTTSKPTKKTLITKTQIHELVSAFFKMTGETTSDVIYPVTCTVYEFGLRDFSHEEVLLGTLRFLAKHHELPAPAEIEIAFKAKDFLAYSKCESLTIQRENKESGGGLEMFRPSLPAAK